MIKVNFRQVLVNLYGCHDPRLHPAAIVITIWNYRRRRRHL